MATWARPFMVIPWERRASLRAARLDPDDLERAEQADRVDLRAAPERDVGRVRERLAEGRVHGDPLARAPHLDPGVPVDVVLPVVVARVHEAVHAAGGD